MPKSEKTVKTVTPKRERVNSVRTRFPQIIESIRRHRGLLTYVAEDMGVSRPQVTRWVDGFPEIREAVIAAREQTIDFAENCLVRNIGEGDTTANIFYLKCMAKTRGYIDRQVLDVGITGAVNVGVDMRGWTDEELEKKIRAIESRTGGPASTPA